MKRLVLLASLVLTLPITAFANTVDFTNSGGNLAGTVAGMTLTLGVLPGAPSVLTVVDGLGKIQTGDLGVLSFTTGKMTVGSLLKGGTFAPGGTFTLSPVGVKGIPAGVVFNGAFDGVTTWTAQADKKGVLTGYYTLRGLVTGAWSNDPKVTVTAFTSQAYFVGAIKGGAFSVTLGSGDTFVPYTAAPEPGALGLLGTGLVGLAGVFRKKLKN